MGRPHRIRSGLCRMLISVNACAYAELYRDMQNYNSLKPFHEDTGIPYSAKEKIGFQRANIRALLEKAKARKVGDNIRFYLVERTRIQMSLDGKVYRP